MLADCQTAGRGPPGRSFQSPAGKGLFFSVLWRPDCAPEKLLSLTALSAVAVCRTVQRVTGVRPQIKWPNDLVLGGRKLAGILTEMSLEGESGHVSHVVVGIGINVHQQPEDFTGEVADIATSLTCPWAGRSAGPGWRRPCWRRWTICAGRCCSPRKDGWRITGRPA
ncbi:MAG: biotin--[acetyl-CoA-carboxylase] ligase [Oscillospiraceae bacterium]